MANIRTIPAGAASPFRTAGLVALASVLLLLPARPARAGSASASLAVSVVVPPRAILSVDAEPASLSVTPEDVARGYVDVPVATRARVRTNTPEGWLLEIHVAPGPWRSLEVTGLGAPAQVSGSGGFLARPYPGTTRPVPLELSCRFLLAPDAAPGLYPWPVALAATPR